MSYSDTPRGSSRRFICNTRGGLKRFKRNGRRSTGRWAGALAAAVCVSVCVSAGAQNFSPAAAAPTASTAPDCGYQSPEEARAAIRAAVEAGEIVDPSTRPLPQVAARTVFGGQQRGGGVPTVTAADITLYEDSASLLLTNFSDGALFDLMADATNAVLATEGDNFDFVGFFLNFAPDHTIGAAFYLGLENDTSGIGQGIFNQRPFFGVAGNNLQGWVMMWRESSWGPDPTTMLVLGQEFEHRWGLFLSPLLDGRSLQGNNAGCGRTSHWNWQIDGQGSGMEIREWIGSSPAVLGGDCAAGGFPFICNNSDIGNSPMGLGAVFSYSDLYLMGYVSPAEMDAGNSELRYMDNSDCNSPYNGAISTFASADIVASNGARIPDSLASQQDFRTAWVMIHLPGAPPTAGELNNVVNMLNLWSEAWEWGTILRGTMDNTIQRAFSIAFPNGTPGTLVPDQATTFDVLTTNDVGMPDTASGLLNFSIDGGPLQTAPLAFLGGDNYQATIPGVACGSGVSYFVSIDAVGGAETVNGPAGAPAITLTALSLPALFVDDNFEADVGYAISYAISGDATDGQWGPAAPGIPIGGGDRGDPPTDADGSGQCWLTDNVDGNSDVDGGSTILTSVAYDLTSLADPYISYARWYSNTAGAAPQADIFVVEVSDDNGASWLPLETVGPTTGDTNPEVSGGWFSKTFRLADVAGLAITNQFRIRFNASDLGSGSVVEAGLDALKIFDCQPCPGHDGDTNGDTATDGLDIPAFVDGIVNGTADPVLICAGDFDNSGALGLGDVPGMVTALLSP